MDAAPTSLNRRKKSSKERRAQRDRAEARALQRILRGPQELKDHRGCELSVTGKVLHGSLVEVTKHAPIADEVVALAFVGLLAKINQCKANCERILSTTEGYRQPHSSLFVQHATEPAYSSNHEWHAFRSHCVQMFLWTDMRHDLRLLDSHKFLRKKRSLNGMNLSLGKKRAVKTVL